MFQHTKAFSSFAVRDLAAAKKFYSEVLELTIEDAFMSLRLKLTGAGEVNIYPKPDHVPAVFTILNFSVENIDEAVDTLVQKGISFERYEGFSQDEKGIMRGLSQNRGPDIAWFTDPSGNILSVLQEK